MASRSRAATGNAEPTPINDKMPNALTGRMTLHTALLPGSAEMSERGQANRIAERRLVRYSHAHRLSLLIAAALVSSSSEVKAVWPIRQILGDAVCCLC